MSGIDDIKRAIAYLSTEERFAIERWISELDPEKYGVAEPATAYGAAPEHRRFSVDEYLEFEAHSSVRHEYINGAIHAMSGASEVHESIAVNLLAAVHTHLRGGPCKVYGGNFKLRLQVNRENLFYYPDLMVACTREGLEPYYHRNPKLIVEVLSPSTASVDRREKLLNYTQIPTLDEYVLVSQDKQEVVLHRRADNWAPSWIEGADAVVEFGSIGLSLPVKRIYEGVLQSS